MRPSDRNSILIAIIFISLGVLFLVLTIIPGVHLAVFWPLIFFVLAVGFYLPPLIWQTVRKELVALFIPGTIMFFLGAIFLYNTITDDWAMWAYGWLLILAGVGIGITLAAWLGEWGSNTQWVGIWLTIANVALFSLFSVLFGNAWFKAVGPILLIICGVVLLIRSLRRPTK